MRLIVLDNDDDDDDNNNDNNNNNNNNNNESNYNNNNDNNTDDSIQEQFLGKNYIKFHKDQAAESTLFRMCRAEIERVSQIVWYIRC